MSLYEPSIRSRNSAWSIISRRFSRRFTTLEGWREIGVGVYTMGNNNIRMFSIKHQFDSEQFRNENPRLDDEVSFTTPRDAPPVPSISNVDIEEYRTWSPSKGTVGKAIGSVKDKKGRLDREKEMDFERAIQTDEKRKYVLSEREEGGRQVVCRARQPPRPYHVYEHKEKWTLVMIVGAAGVFPALSTWMYLPALDAVAQGQHVSIELAAVTVATFLAIQGLAPLIWAPLSDSLGRRSVYIYSFLLYFISTIVLSYSLNFPVLLIFRGIQGAGIASTVCIGNAIIHDIASPLERESFHGFYVGIRNITTIVAPIIGGVLSHFPDFRSIFVFLFGLSIAALVVITLFFPETQRSIAGNGSLPLTGIHEPLIWKCKFFGKPAHVDERQEPGVAPKLKLRRVIAPLKLVLEKDILLSLIFGGMTFAIWMMVTVSTVGLFKMAFNLNEIILGLAFIPNVLGTIAGATLVGNLLTRDFHHTCSSYKARHGLPPSTLIPYNPLPADFPLEHTRLVRLPGLLVIFFITLGLYGFTLYYPSLYSRSGWITIPLLLQFVISTMAHAICGIHHTLISDLCPRDGAAGTMISNAVRYVLAAVGAGTIYLIIDCFEVAATFLAFALILMVLVPLPIVQWYYGEEWRKQREAREAAAHAQQSEKV